MLEKYAKMHNIEKYTLSSINLMWKIYSDYLDKNKNKDIDYPNVNFKLK